jgi:Cytochrome c554 and c-prime
MIAGRNLTACLAIAACGWLFFRADEATAQYVDTSSGCIQCHETALRQNDFCPSVPEAVWAGDDKHRRAFYLLHERDPTDPQKGAAKRELVRRILGFELREAFVDERYLRLKEAGDAETATKVRLVKSCLRCHATWPKEADESYPSVPPVALDLGVSCQACHGAGEKWDVTHRLPAWRLVTPAGKASLRFADCRSSEAKARLCASCHVGDVSQEKFVKHEWYAAGHPPLPSFELASFQKQMPAHWKSLREKGAFAFRDSRPADDAGVIEGQIETLKRNGVAEGAIKESYREANFPGAAAKGLDPCGDLAGAKDAIVAGAVAMQVYARLVGDYAGAAADSKAAWPELALYDCAACHHELRSGLGVSTRPRRNHAPGRPPLATWPGVLAKLAAHQAAAYEAAQSESRWSLVMDAWQKLDRATTDRPFGDSAAMQAAAEQLAAVMIRLVDDTSNTRYEAAAARGAIALLTDEAQYETNDFATARQAGWALRAVLGDVGFRETDGIFSPGGDDPLCLTLPSGPQRSVMENLRRWLPAAAKYDAAWFRAELKTLRKGIVSE